MGSRGQFQPIAIILYFKCFFHTIALSTNSWVNNGAVVLLFVCLFFQHESNELFEAEE